MLFYKRAEQRLVALKRQKDAHRYSKPARPNIVCGEALLFPLNVEVLDLGPAADGT